MAGLAILAIVTAGLIAGTHRAVTLDPTVRVAVVPFDNETGMDDFDRIARGVADATVARLAAPARIGRISVIGNAAALHQPRRFRDLKRIGLELGADYIVLAQMKRDAAQVRLIAHLIRVADESHVWQHLRCPRVHARRAGPDRRDDRGIGHHGAHLAILIPDSILMTA